MNGSRSAIAMKTNWHFPECLKARVAPATLSPDGHTVTYVDLDGDIVTVKTSKGTFDLATNSSSPVYLPAPKNAT
jgi:hypothetical protein